MKRERLDALDGLRGIAACAVAFFWHYRNFGAETNPWDWGERLFYGYGWLAVEFFFLTSGFVMFYAYRQPIQKGEISFQAYILKRLKHIYPLMLITLLATAAGQVIHIKMTGSSFVYGNTDLRHFLYNFLLIQNGYLELDFSFNGPAWCISVEFFLYILFFCLMKGSRKIAGEVSGIIMVIAGAAVILLGVNKPLINSQMALGGMCFFMGGLLEKGYEKGCVPGRVNKIISCIMAIFIIAAWFLCPRLHPEVLTVRMSFSLVIGPLLIWSALQAEGWKKILQWKGFQILGSLSLEIYLWHFPVQCLIENVNLLTGEKLDYSRTVIWFCYAGVTFLCAVISSKVKKMLIPRS